MESIQRILDLFLFLLLNLVILNLSLMIKCRVRLLLIDTYQIRKTPMPCSSLQIIRWKLKLFHFCWWFTSFGCIFIHSWIWTTQSPQTLRFFILQITYSVAIISDATAIILNTIFNPTLCVIAHIYIQLIFIWVDAI